jgi:hypothetical protein
MSNEPTDHRQGEGPTSEFERMAGQTQPGLLAEFVDFLRHNKKWWLTPIILVLVLFGALVMLSGSGMLPFIYPL